jgi:hypothetical protein
MARANLLGFAHRLAHAIEMGFALSMAHCLLLPAARSASEMTVRPPVRLLQKPPKSWAKSNLGTFGLTAQLRLSSSPRWS